MRGGCSVMLLVALAIAGSAADKSGLKEGNVVLKCQVREIGSIDDLLKTFNPAATGTKMTGHLAASAA